MFTAPLCRTCLLPEALVPHFGAMRHSDGTCRLCAAHRAAPGVYEPDYGRTAAEFERLAMARRGKGRYDAIVLYTGGKDSTYTLSLLVQKYSLRVLALTWDNGFFDEHVRSNIAVVTKSLGVDHQFVGPDRDVLMRLYRNRMENYGRFCQCVPLAFLFAMPAIEEHAPPSVFCSISYGQMISMAEWATPAHLPQGQRPVLFKRILATLGSVPLPRLIDNIYYTNLLDFVVGNLPRTAAEALAQYYHPMNGLREGRDIFVVHPAYYFSWDPTTIVQTIAKLGWRLPEGKSDYGHTSCSLEPMKGYLSYLQGIINFDLLELAVLLRTGKIDKDAFRRELHALGYCDDEPATMDRLLDDLGLDRPQLTRLLRERTGRRAALPDINEENLRLFPVDPESARVGMRKAFKERILI